MKIKNFKINKKAASKLAACVLVGTITATALTGCGATVDRNNLLKGTILENTCVVTFKDGSKDIAVSIDYCVKTNYNYHHYYSIITGEYFVDEQCDFLTLEGNYVYHYEITNEENILNYLTTDDLKKAMQGNLDNNDIIDIAIRAIEPVNEENNPKTR